MTERLTVKDLSPAQRAGARKVLEAEMQRREVLEHRTPAGNRWTWRPACPEARFSPRYAHWWRCEDDESAPGSIGKADRDGLDAYDEAHPLPADLLPDWRGDEPEAVIARDAFLAAARATGDAERTLADIDAQLAGLALRYARVTGDTSRALEQDPGLEEDHSALTIEYDTVTAAQEQLTSEAVGLRGDLERAREHEGRCRAAYLAAMQGDATQKGRP